MSGRYTHPSEDPDIINPERFARKLFQADPEPSEDLKALIRDADERGLATIEELTEKKRQVDALIAEALANPPVR